MTSGHAGIVGDLRAPNLTLTALLRERSARSPERVVMRFLGDRDGDERCWTFGQLHRRARAIGARLEAMGATGQRVLLLHPPGEEYVAALFGCLAAGAVAVPAYPPRFNRPMVRLRTVVADCQARFALTTTGPLERVQAQRDREPTLAALSWLASDEVSDAEGDHWCEPIVSPDALALLQYTSGSVSAPRGVMLSQGHFLRNIAAMNERVRATPDDRWVTWLPPYHDMGLVGPILSLVYTGAEVTFLSPGDFLQRPLRWLSAISRFAATISGAPNFAYELCVRRIAEEQRAALDLRSWRFAFCGAERVRPETLDRFCAAFGSAGFRRGAFVPAYGLAEATLGVSFGDARAEPTVVSFDDAGLGRGRAELARPGERARALVGCGGPLPGSEVIVAEPQTAARQPDGAVGEIWVRSGSVASGYWGQAELSRQTFAARVTGDDGGPFLRTGDLGFLRAGELFVVGRLKDLIILRGTNHYPEDIEGTVERCQAGFRPGGCAAFSVEVDGEERLVIVLEIDSTQRDAAASIAAAIRGAIVEQHELTVHDVVLVGRLAVPRTSSGKVQRSRCRRLYLDGALERVAVVAPPGDAAGTEAPAALVEQIARTMAELLHIPTVLPDDDFFWLGGHSLMATMLTSRLAESLQRAVPIEDIFAAPTPRALAARLQAGPRLERATPIAPVDRAGPLRPSFSQERMWFLHELDRQGSAYNVAGALALEGPLDRTALDRTFAEIVRRHEIVRTNYRAVDGEPRVLLAPARPVPLEVKDLSRETDPDAAANAAASRLAREPFDVARELLVRAGLYQTGPDRHLLALSMHHLITDAWSMGLLLEDFWRLYEAFVLERPLPPDERHTTYLDYAHWQREALTAERLRAELDHWTGALAGVEPLQLPLDRPRSRRRSSRGGLEPFLLDRELLQALRALGNTRGATIFMVTLAAFIACLHRHTGQTDMVVGIPVANRNRLASEHFLGTLVNTLALRVRFEPSMTFAALLQRVREVAIEAYGHQDLPFERLVASLPVERTPGTSPLIQAMFDFQNAPMAAGGAAGLRGRPVPVSREASQFDLSLLVLDTELGHMAGLEYSTDLFDPTTVRRFAERYRAVLESLVVDPEQPLSNLGILPAAEEREILGRAHRTIEGRVPPSLLARFAARARETPEAPAVTDARGTLSYRQLDERSAALAAELRSRGAGPGRRVAVYLDRSTTLPVTLLAILKTGAAYVPLDPRHPAARVHLVMADAEPTLLVTETRLRDRAPGTSGVALVLVDETEARSSAEALPPLSEDPTRAAYVIYTSGSTGQPKGVEISTGALANFLQSMSHTPGMAARDRLLSLTTIAFDIAGLELFLPLWVGASVHLAPADVVADGPRLVALVKQVSPTLVQATPATWRLLVEAGWPGDPALTMLCGGEPMPPELAEQLLCKGAALWNMYGPTETTVWSTVHRVVRAEDPIPIGQAIDETSVYVLDGQGRLCPFGVAGEIHLGGLGVANGYFRRPALTSERFVADPFRPGERLYRTGDLGRLRSDGQLEHLGRLDHQIKIRGFRIEPGEIEALLREDDRIRDALVLAREDRPGDVRLVAYYVAAAEAGGDDLRQRLKQRLPDYMVPSAFVALPAFPRTPNGKIDRAALPAPDPKDAPVAGRHRPPRDPLEARLAALWEEVLGTSQPGIGDDFFSLGGHSLLAVRLFARIHGELGLELPLALLFEAPTIEGLAEAIRSRQAPGAPAPPSREGPSLAPAEPLSHVVLIRDGGPRPPLFCVHGAGGNVLTFAGLARYLGADRPFYGLQARGVDGRSAPLPRIEQMAAAYLAEIRRVQPRGPYHLAGYCGGGTIAFELGRLLRAAGEEVGLLALLDTYHPRVDVSRTRLRRLLAGVSSEGLRFPLRRLRARVARELEALGVWWRVRYHRLRGRAVPLELRDYWLTTSFFAAERRYRPELYPGKLSILRARDASPLLADVPPDLGWAGLAEEIQLHDTPGTHDTLVIEPHAQALATILRTCLGADD